MCHRADFIPLLLLAIAAGCTDRAQTEPLSATGSVASLGSAPIRLAPVPLIVTISNADVLGRPYMIRNDGLGDYTDGTQRVQAILDISGTFAFNTFSSGKAAIRWVTYDFSSPIDPNNPYRPTPANSENFHFSTGASALSPFIPLQTLGVNGNPSTECIYMGNGISNATTSWRVSFHKGNEDVASSPAAFAVATRVSVSPAVWTIEPVGSCSPNSNVGALRNGDGTVLYGYYYLPFFFRLRAK